MQISNSKIREKKNNAANKALFRSTASSCVIKTVPQCDFKNHQDASKDTKSSRRINSIIAQLTTH